MASLAALEDDGDETSIVATVAPAQKFPQRQCTRDPQHLKIVCKYAHRVACLTIGAQGIVSCQLYLAILWCTAQGMAVYLCTGIVHLSQNICFRL